MATKNERKIVHVWDIFGGKKLSNSEVIDTLEDAETQASKSKNSRNTSSSSGGSGDVFFGNNNNHGTLAELKAKRRQQNLERAKQQKNRAAPSPPVLVDIDVKVDEQGLNKDVVKDDQPQQPVTTNLAGGKVPRYQKQMAPSPNKAVVGAKSTSADLESHLQSLQLKDKNKVATRSNSDRSSSGVDTDESGETPKGSIDKPPRSALDSQQKDKPKEYDSGREEDLEEFEENEMTLDFGAEEDGPAEGQFPKLFAEYQGEDFSQYMQDDEPGAIDPFKAQRKYKKNTVTASSKSLSPSPSHSVSSAGKRTLRKILHRSTNKNHMNKHISSSMGNIHSFSWADSKMGLNDTNDDGKQWWSKSMLSAQKAGGNTDVLLVPRRGSTPRKDDDLVSSLSDSNLLDRNTTQKDFESYRKNKIYNSKTPKSGKKNILQRLTDTLKKSDRKKMRAFKDNTTRNPLNDSDSECD